MEFELIPTRTDAIQPVDIDASHHLFEAFQNQETEVSAGWIVRFCQERDEGWADFTYADIEAYYQSKGRKDGFWFNKLFVMGYLYDKTFKPKENWDRHKAEDVIGIDFRFVAKCYVSGLNQRFGDRHDI